MFEANTLMFDGIREVWLAVSPYYLSSQPHSGKTEVSAFFPQNFLLGFQNLREIPNPKI